MADSEVRYVVRHPDSAGGFTAGRYTYDEVVALMGGMAHADNLLSREVGGYYWDAQYWGVSTATDAATTEGAGR